MKVSVNGEEREIAPGTTAAVLLEILEMAGSRIAVERNGAVIARENLGDVTLGDGDRIEVIHFVGGGH